MDQPHNLDMVARKLAKDLVEMHEKTAIEIEHWGNALELVSLYYNTTVTFELKPERKEPNFTICSHENFSTSPQPCNEHHPADDCWQNACDNCNRIVSHEK